jgi:hypothetical protein
VFFIRRQFGYGKANSATIAATRFTIDSTASDKRPTDPVRKKASALSAIVVMAAVILLIYQKSETPSKLPETIRFLSTKQ